MVPFVRLARLQIGPRFLNNGAVIQLEATIAKNNFEFRLRKL